MEMGNELKIYFVNRWTIRTFFLFFLISILYSCYKVPPPPPPGPYVSPETRYPIGPGDTIEIRLVPDDLNFSGVYQVDDEGRILLPLLGELYVTGLTSVSLRQRVESLLLRYMREPKVAVFIREMKSQKIFVWTPEKVGVIFVQRPISVLETAILAGVSPRDSKISRIYVLRWDESKKKSDIYSVDLEKILREGDFTQNVYLTPGDIVFIPPKYITGVREFLSFYSGIGWSLLYGFSGLQVLGIAK